MTDKDDIIAELEAQLAETEQFLEQVHSFYLTVKQMFRNLDLGGEE